MVSIKHTLHMSQEDLSILDPTNLVIMTMLKNKFIIRADDNKEGEVELLVVFSWLNKNCHNFYAVRGPEREPDDSVKFYVYFSNPDEALQFKTSFPR